MTVRDPYAKAGDADGDRAATEAAATARSAGAPAPSEAAEPAVAAPPPCPRCGTPLREDQDWCLNCGAAATTRVAPPAGWRAPLAIVAAVLALAFAGLVVAFLAVSNDSDELTRLGAKATTNQAVPAAPTPAPPAAASGTVCPAAGGVGVGVAAGDDALPGLDSLPEATGGSQEDDEGSGSGSGSMSGGTGTGGSSQVGTWPSGRSAFTVVLLSSPTRAGANRRARTLSGSGTDVGVLDSDDFSSLNGGYFVVFSGQYDTRDAAEDALTGLSADAPGAYVRRVTPR